MAALSTKIYAVVTIPVALSIATAFLAITERGPDAGFLYRLAIALAVTALLLALSTWALHRISLIESSLCAESSRANQTRRQVRDMEKRLAEVEDKLRCLELVRDMWTVGDAELSTLLNNNPEDK